MRTASLMLATFLGVGCATTPVAREFDVITGEDVGPTLSWAEVSTDWWTVFGDDTLNALVASALADNTSLRAAWMRLEQAGYAAGIANASRFPQVSLGASGGRVRQPSFATGGVIERDRWSMSLGVAYELDLWGRLAAVSGRSKALERASAYDYQAMSLSLSASVCEAWFSLNEQMLLLDLLNAQLDASVANAESIERRYRRGLGSLLDVYQQRELVANVRSRLPGIKAQADLARNRLAVLVGLLPGESFVDGVRTLPTVPPPDAGDLDAYVVENRPDVRAVFERLSASERAATAAWRDRLPSLSISVGGGYQAEDAGDLWDEWTSEATLGLQLPLTDGGRRRAEAERLRAETRERLESYAETVRQAMREVYDARVLEMHQAETVLRLQEELTAARNTLKQSRDRYENGLVDYLSVLSALSRVQQLERTVVSAMRAELSYRVQFCRAIAGTIPAEKMERR